MRAHARHRFQVHLLFAAVHALVGELEQVFVDLAQRAGNDFRQAGARDFAALGEHGGGDRAGRASPCVDIRIGTCVGAWLVHGGSLAERHFLLRNNRLLNQCFGGDYPIPPYAIGICQGDVGQRPSDIFHYLILFNSPGCRRRLTNHRRPTGAKPVPESRSAPWGDSQVILRRRPSRALSQGLSMFAATPFIPGLMA